nr:DciA family protein [Sphingomonas sp. EC-HK361]
MSKRPTSTTDAPRANRARQVAELLPDVGRAAFRKFGFVQSSIVSRWGEIVGEKLSRVSTPESIRFPVGRKQDGILTLTVRGAHAPMMQHITPEIVERVNRFFGYVAVERVVIRQGEVAVRPERRAPPSLKVVPVELGNSLKTIADPELKAVLEALAAGVAATRGVPQVK